MQGQNGTHAVVQGGQKLKADVWRGSVRSLLLETEDFKGPPARLPHKGWAIDYMVENMPSLHGVIPLLEDNQLVSYDAVIPGLKRAEAVSGDITVGLSDTLNALAAPTLCPTRSITLECVSISIHTAIVEYAPITKTLRTIGKCTTV